MKMYEILNVKDTTWAVVQIKPEKNSGLYRSWTHGLCDIDVSALPIKPTSQLAAGHFAGLLIKEPKSDE